MLEYFQLLRKTIIHNVPYVPNLPPPTLEIICTETVLQYVTAWIMQLMYHYFSVKDKLNSEPFQLNLLTYISCPQLFLQKRKILCSCKLLNFLFLSLFIFFFDDFMHVYIMLSDFSILLILPTLNNFSFLEISFPYSCFLIEFVTC